MARGVGRCSWSTGSRCARWPPSCWLCSCPKRTSRSPGASTWRSWASVTWLCTGPRSTHVNMGSSLSASCSRACPTLWRWVEDLSFLFPFSSNSFELSTFSFFSFHFFYSFKHINIKQMQTCLTFKKYNKTGHPFNDLLLVHLYTPPCIYICISLKTQIRPLSIWTL